MYEKWERRVVGKTSAIYLWKCWFFSGLYDLSHMDQTGRFPFERRERVPLNNLAL